MHDDDPTVALTAGDTTVVIHPAAGGRIGQIDVAGQPLLIDVPPADARPAIAWGLFPMAPWVGRIREGRFRFAGSDHQLMVNHHDGDRDDPHRAHSIHGTVFTQRWAVEDATDATATLSCPLEGELDWPFAGTAQQRLALSANRLTLELAITTESEPMPAELGWHPWFRKPDHLDFAPREMYRRDRFGIPSGELVAPTSGPWDDCFVNTRPVTLRYDRDIAPAVTVAADCDHWVVFDELAESTCVEPQSGPPDAVNLVHHVVASDAPLRRTMSITW